MQAGYWGGSGGWDASFAPAASAASLCARSASSLSLARNILLCR